MQKIGAAHRTNLYFLLNPVGARLRDILLRQVVVKFQPCFCQQERLALLFFRIQPGDKTRFAEQKTELFDAGERCLEFIKGVNRKIGRDDGESRAVFDLLFQKLRDGAEEFVIADV